jgi:hypothetical protein
VFSDLLRTIFEPMKKRVIYAHSNINILNISIGGLMRLMLISRNFGDLSSNPALEVLKKAFHAKLLLRLIDKSQKLLYQFA